MLNFKQVLCLAGPSAIVLTIFAVLARASEADCNDAQDKVSLARVVTTDAKLNFIAGPGKQTPGCPSAGGACKLKAFLVPGDEVLVNATDGPFVCAIFKSQAGTETRGWLPRAALQLAAPEAAPAPKWAGKWRRDRRAEIVLKSAGDKVKVSGTPFGALATRSASRKGQFMKASSTTAASRGVRFSLSATTLIARVFRPPGMGHRTAARRNYSCLTGI